MKEIGDYIQRLIVISPKGPSLRSSKDLNNDYLPLGLGPHHLQRTRCGMMEM